MESCSSKKQQLTKKKKKKIAKENEDSQGKWGWTGLMNSNDI